MFLFLLLTFIISAVLFIWFCVFFDQGIFFRKDTIFRLPTSEKKVILTFDDGPSPSWTSPILDVLKEEKVKAIFFMIGHHVQKYPEVARRVANEGHVIANHGYAHSVVFYYTLPEIEEEIKYTEYVIREITGQTTHLFRPPKAWLRKDIKKKIKSMGYDIMLWSINSKDWVGFSADRIVRNVLQRVQAGDILLFHDSGSVMKAEGGDRAETVRAVRQLIKDLREQGFEFVTG